LGLLLEHGCEKHHNDFIANALRTRGVDPEQYGWASVQLDGGIEKVTQKVGTWFENAASKFVNDSRQQVGLSSLVVAIMCSEPTIDQKGARTFSGLVQSLVQAGASVLIPQRCALLTNPSFLDDLMDAHGVTPSLAFGQPLVKHGGCFVMATPTSHWVEILGGLCSSGAQIALALSTRPMQGHPMLPVLQISTHFLPSSDFDGWIDADVTEQHNVNKLIGLAVNTLSMVDDRFVRRVTSNVDFQISRGELGCST
jgi:altronate dehydratase